MDSPSTVLPASASAAAESPAGIHCANPDCRTRAGERSRGHQSCRALLCGHCCQHAAKAAADAGEQRPVCKVHARRVHTGHRPLPKDQLLPRAETGSPSSTGDAVQELQDMLEKRARLEESLKRSLTLVIWYRNGCDPLRIAHEVTTFPLFQLQDFPDLVNELGLQLSSYIDVYNADTGLWEQHKISTVRSVEQDQRLLYRLRPSLLDSLVDCPSLDQELSLQPPPSAYQLKRQVEAHTSPPTSKQARVISNSNPVRAPNTASPAVVQSYGSPTGGPPVNSAPPNINDFNLSPSNNAPPANHASSSTAVTTDIDIAAAARRWPTDFTVYDITSGFDAMEAIIKAEPGARQKSAFERVFAPCRYVKSTVGRAKLYWKRASPEIRDHFLALPHDDPSGRWSQFVHLMDGRLVIELGKDKVGVDGEKDSGDEEEAVNGSLSFDSPRITHFPPGARMNVQSPVAITTHSALPITRQPTIATLIPNQISAIPQRPGAPVMTMPQPYATTERRLSLNRASSSLSGAMTIPNH